MAEQEKKFEDSLKELEEIVSRLEEGDVPLEEALNQFQEGIKLSRTLKKTLNEADELLTKIVDENGDETLFEGNPSLDSETE